MQGLHVSVAACRRCGTSDKTSSCSEDQQRNDQSSHETNQQFHLELLLTGERVAGWYGYWLADGSGITREAAHETARNTEHEGVKTRGAAWAAPASPASSGLAFVKRQRHDLRVMIETAAACADTAFHHDAAHGIRALAAAGGDAEFELEFVERVDAFRDRGTDLSVRNRLADTDNHGRAS